MVAAIKWFGSTPGRQKNRGRYRLVPHAGNGGLITVQRVAIFDRRQKRFDHLSTGVSVELIQLRQPEVITCIVERDSGASLGCSVSTEVLHKTVRLNSA